MFRIRTISLVLALLILLGLGINTFAAEVDCDATYCFSAEDFSEAEELAGICITQLPAADSGTVMLGSRVLQPGDILTADQLAQMTFLPLRTEEDREAVVTYLPIYEDRVEKSTTMTISIRGKEDLAPVAEDFSLETYKNLPNQGSLKVSDPEGEALTYTLVRNPKRGEVTIDATGNFVYTPKKNKVGVDSFTYTAADPAGNVSRVATVTIQILKPTDSKQYTDTVSHPCRFAAEWMRNTGLFVGEKIGGEECFRPEKEVTRGEFLAMVIKSLNLPVEDVSYDDLPADTPQWLKPYLIAALRSGLTEGLPADESGSFRASDPITQMEAAVILQNALDLNISQQALEELQASAPDNADALPAWAAVSVTAMAENGIGLSSDTPLTRGDMATALYQVSQIAIDAPGLAVFRMQ